MSSRIYNNFLEGCKLKDGTFKKFMEIWVEEDQIKRKCSWISDANGIPKFEILEFGNFFKQNFQLKNIIFEKKQHLKKKIL